MLNLIVVILIVLAIFFISEQEWLLIIKLILIIFLLGALVWYSSIQATIVGIYKGAEMALKQDLWDGRKVNLELKILNKRILFIEPFTLKIRQPSKEDEYQELAVDSKLVSNVLRKRYHNDAEKISRQYWREWEERGVKQEEFAHRIGISTRTLRNYINDYPRDTSQ